MNALAWFRADVWRLVAAIGLLSFLVSWFLPVFGGNLYIASGMAVVFILADFPRSDETWKIIGAMSALTNLLMIRPIVATVRRRVISPWWAWSLIVAGTLNTWWFFMEGGSWRDLGPGYYTWLLSFVVVGVASLAAGRAARREPAEL